MNMVGLVATTLLFCLAIAIAAINWKHFVRNYQNRQRSIEKHYAVVPGLSCLLGVVAGFIHPQGPGAWIVLPIIFDPGTWIVFFIPWMLARRWAGKD